MVHDVRILTACCKSVKLYRIHHIVRELQHNDLSAVALSQSS